MTDVIRPADWPVVGGDVSAAAFAADRFGDEDESAFLGNVQQHDAACIAAAAAAVAAWDV